MNVVLEQALSEAAAALREFCFSFNFNFEANHFTSRENDSDVPYLVFCPQAGLKTRVTRSLEPKLLITKRRCLLQARVPICNFWITPVYFSV